MVRLVKDAIADEELRSEPPQKLLIINRCTLGLLLSFKIPLHFMKPRFVCYFLIINLIVVCWFIQPLDSDSGSFIVPLDLEH